MKKKELKKIVKQLETENTELRITRAIHIEQVRSLQEVIEHYKKVPTKYPSGTPG
jgi:hypothetical protein